MYHTKELLARKTRKVKHKHSMKGVYDPDQGPYSVCVCVPVRMASGDSCIRGGRLFAVPLIRIT